MMRACIRAIGSLSVFSLVAACGSSAGNLFDSNGGGAGAPMGGSSATGGGTGTALGGSPGEVSGGVTSTGGAAVGGGAEASGGNPVIGTGGASNGVGGKASGAGGTGGAAASGGASSAGAAPTSGGALASGGASSEGGAPAEGGTSTSGGAMTTGGSAMGGTLAAGGVQSSGGVPATGGAPSVAPIVQSGSIATPQFASFACQHVTFATPFTTEPSKLRVLVSVVHPGSGSTHDPVAAWAQNVSATGFDACLTKDKGFDGEHPVARIDWVALSEPEASTWKFRTGRQALTGSATPDCSSVSVGNDAGMPYHIEVSHEASNTDQNRGTAVWVENVNAGDFRVCAVVLENAKGPISSSAVDWTVYSPSGLEHGFSAGELDFTMSWREGTQCKKVPTNCKGCQNAQVSVNHRRRNEDDPKFLHGAILVWAEDFNEAGELTVCVRETSAENGSHDAHLSVDWLVRDHND